eukprot:5938997-Amphidinium_carterae.1
MQMRFSNFGCLCEPRLTTMGLQSSHAFRMEEHSVFLAVHSGASCPLLCQQVELEDLKEMLTLTCCEV